MVGKRTLSAVLAGAVACGWALAAWAEPPAATQPAEALVADQVRAAARILDDRARLAAYDRIAMGLAERVDVAPPATQPAASPSAAVAAESVVGRAAGEASGDAIAAPRPVAPALGDRGAWRVSVQGDGDTRVVLLSLDAESPITAWPDKTYTPVLNLRSQSGTVSAYVTTGFRSKMKRNRTDVVEAVDGVETDLVMRASGDRLSLFWRDGSAALGRLRGGDRLAFTFEPMHSGDRTAEFDLRGLAALAPLLVGTPE
ncbi:MAG: hypothetical protein AAF612_01335 [Planctomycetota bacterium]